MRTSLEFQSRIFPLPARFALLLQHAMATRRAVRYAVIDAFAGAPFGGNPAAVCFLEGFDGGPAADTGEQWMQLVAMEFNAPCTAFVYPDASGDPGVRFHIRWFAPRNEIELCGHATIAAAHFLRTSSLSRSDVIEFSSKKNDVLSAKVVGERIAGNGATVHSIELDFPIVRLVDCDPTELPRIPLTLDGAAMANVQKTATSADIVIELASAAVVADLKPDFNEIERCPGRGLIVTGLAPPGSEYDFYTRFFCPKVGVNEDQVCGSAHCSLAPYWSKKLGKQKLTAYMASSRGGRLDLQVDEVSQRVLIRGEAVLVMEGSLFA